MWVASKDCFQLVDSPMFWNFSKFPVNNRVPANNPVFTKTGIARFWNIKSNIAAHQNSRVDPGNLLVPSMTWNSGPFKIRFFRYCSSTTTVVQRLFRVIWHNWRLWPNHWELRNFLHMAFKDEGQSYISVKSQLEITEHKLSNTWIFESSDFALSHCMINPNMSISIPLLYIFHLEDVLIVIFEVYVFAS